MRRAIRLPPLKIQPGKSNENPIFSIILYVESNQIDWPRNPGALLPVMIALPGK